MDKPFELRVSNRAICGFCGNDLFDPGSGQNKVTVFAGGVTTTDPNAEGIRTVLSIDGPLKLACGFCAELEGVKAKRISVKHLPQGREGARAPEVTTNVKIPKTDGPRSVTGRDRPT
jgi:hypothetical protein